MSNDLFSEILNRFKQNEKPEVVLLIADNPDLAKIIIAWVNIDVRPLGKLSVLKDNCELETWNWLWNNTQYSLKELKDKTGTSLSENALRNKLKPVIGNRLIYPDGTVNSYVERYLRDQVLKLFETKQKRNSQRNYQ